MVEQSERAPARVELGAPEATRAWFFNLEDGPWHEQPHGVEGLVVEGGTLDLVAGSARFVLEVLPGSEPAANRCLDLLLLTSDLEDTFKTRGTRAYPILDEIGVAAAGRVFMRITNPADSGESFHVEGKYTVNRVPWTFPGVHDRQDGAGARERLDRCGWSRASGRRGWTSRVGTRRTRGTLR